MRALLKNRELKFETIELAVLTNSVRNLLSYEISSRQCDLEINIDPDIKLLEVDSVQLQQVLVMQHHTAGNNFTSGLRNQAHQ